MQSQGWLTGSTKARKNKTLYSNKKYHHEVDLLSSVVRGVCLRTPSERVYWVLQGCV
jgi:hypothetical protein